MNNTDGQPIKLIGRIVFTILLIFGVFLTMFGGVMLGLFAWINYSGQSGNLTGLLLMAGEPMLLLGLLCLGGLWLAIKLLKIDLWREKN